ncbi:O-antigen ligase family protein [Peribacillus butanolivorans]|uniref:O-antigen ligase family protein n=1 Tax=Peribacillus butanolivorans TaxID=421767 RepID=UPI0036DB2EBF
MIYIFTVLLLLSLMFPVILSPHIVLSFSFLGVIFLLYKKGLLMLKSLFFIHLCWVVFFVLFGINYFYNSSPDFFAEFLLFVCLAASMYIGIFCGMNFRKNLLYIYVVWVYIILIQLLKNNTLNQILNERWTITTGWLYSNAVGAVLVFSIPLLMLCFYLTKTKILKIFILLGILSSVVTLFLLSSRGSLLSLVVIFTFIFFMKKKKIKNIILSIPLLLMLFTVISKVDIIWKSVELTINRVASSGLNGREILWEEGIQSIKDNPLMGIGARNGLSIDLHNPLLHIATHYGLLALVPFTLLMIAPFFYLKLIKFKNTYTIFIFATYLAIIFQSSIEAILTPLITGSIGWYFIGLTFGYLINNYPAKDWNLNKQFKV